MLIYCLQIRMDIGSRWSRTKNSSHPRASTRQHDEAGAKDPLEGKVVLAIYSLYMIECDGEKFGWQIDRLRKL